MAVAACRQFISSSKKLYTGVPLKLMVRMASTLPTFETLSVTVPKEFVYHVELNRPNRANAMNPIMWMELKKCFNTISEDENCRVVVLSGAGKHFTAGLDVQDSVGIFQKVAEQEDVARKAKVFRQIIASFQESISSLEICLKPVIVAVQKACIGAGVDTITAADIRYCTKDAFFEVTEVQLGMAADVGTLQRLPKIIGSSSLTRELCYTGRKMFAPEALSSGLVSKVFEDKEEMIGSVIKLAEEISKKSPVAIQTIKRNLIYSRDHSVQEGLNHIALMNEMMLQSEDFTNGMAAAVTKDSDVTFSKL